MRSVRASRAWTPGCSRASPTWPRRRRTLPPCGGTTRHVPSPTTGCSSRSPSSHPTRGRPGLPPGRHRRAGPRPPARPVPAARIAARLPGVRREVRPRPGAGDPRRRDGPRQDDAGARRDVPPGAPRARRTSWSSARRACWSTGRARSSGTAQLDVAHRLHGADRARQPAGMARARAASPSPRSRRCASMPKPRRVGLAMLVVDEAHYVKNPAARAPRRSASGRRAAERVLFLTGTPMENRVEEFRILVGHLQPATSPRHLDRR